MYAIIVGAGKVGRNLARELIVKGHEVSLIESSRSCYLAIEEEFEHAAQYGDATELWVLERSGIQRADLVVAVTGDDEDNMLVCQVAKEKYLCDRIIARVNNPRNHDHFRLLGIQPAVSATDLILRLIEHEVPRYGLVHLLALEEERLEIIELEVSADAPTVGERVSDIALPEGSLIISVLRDGIGVRAQAGHRDRGGRRGAARARPGPRGGDHRLLRARTGTRAERRGPSPLAEIGARGSRRAGQRAGEPTILAGSVRDGVIGNTRASGARIWGSSPCPGVDEDFASSAPPPPGEDRCRAPQSVSRPHHRRLTAHIRRS